MRIHIECAGPRYETEITRLIHLFYPDVETIFASADQVDKNSDLLIHVTTKLADDVVEAIVQIGASAHFARSTAIPFHDSAIQRKSAKRAVVHALYRALSHHTDRKLPWGVLGGVRPTKLAHDELRRTSGASGASDADITTKLQSDFLMAPDRANLLLEVAQRELQVMPDLYQLDQEVSIYIGIPFCPTHCAYCTFPAYSMVDKARYANQFLDALIKEIRMTGEMLFAYRIPVTTVYVGGGTPSSLMARELRQLLEAIYEYIPGANSWRELSVEAGRADTITPDRVAVMREYGVNRISVNPQTFNAQTLKTIGRGHAPDIVPRRFELCREAGFENINMDLILGLPGETLDDVKRSVEKTLMLKPDAVTIHTLALKRAAVVNRERDSYDIAPDDEIVRMMEHVDHEVRMAGLSPYYLYRQRDILGNLENIGYSVFGKEGLYNISIIEEVQTIIGLGGGASSKWVKPGTAAILRHQNPREPSIYVETLDEVFAKKARDLQDVCEAIASVRELQ